MRHDANAFQSGGLRAAAATIIKSLGLSAGTLAASDGLIWPRVGCASITFPQWRTVDFLPLRERAFLATAKKISGIEWDLGRKLGLGL